jgi:hypothetical protein
VLAWVHHQLVYLCDFYLAGMSIHTPSACTPVISIWRISWSLNGKSLNRWYVNRPNILYGKKKAVQEMVRSLHNGPEATVRWTVCNLPQVGGGISRAHIASIASSCGRDIIQSKVGGLPCFPWEVSETLAITNIIWKTICCPLCCCSSEESIWIISLRPLWQWSGIMFSCLVFGFCFFSIL